MDLDRETVEHDLDCLKVAPVGSEKGFRNAADIDQNSDIVRQRSLQRWAYLWAQVAHDAAMHLKLRKLAEREGFEPSVPVKARRISSAVQSTTLPPLRRRRCRGPKRAGPSVEGGPLTEGSGLHKGLALVVVKSLA